VTSLPLRSVAADSNVLLSAVARRAAWRVFENAPDLVVVTTESVIAEVHEYVPEFAERYGFDVDVLHEAVELLPVERYSEADYLTHVREAKKYLDRRDPDDVHLAALALKLDVPVWSNDRDLTELPLRIFTTAQLLKMLGV
jgi:predicted nucleic acid-binding protein